MNNDTQPGKSDPRPFVLETEFSSEKRADFHNQPDEPHRSPSQDRHTRKCAVCHHPDRDAIQADYLNFRSPAAIARDYGVADDSVYRHFRATGLASKRRAPLRQALESIIEQAANVQPTAREYLQAIYMYAQINDDGEWVGPPCPYPRQRTITKVIDSNRGNVQTEPTPNA